MSDGGAQPERTGLAWQRTALSGLACSLVVAKLVAGRSPVLGVVLSALALLTTAAVFALGRRRYRRGSAAWSEDRPLPDGRLPLAAVGLIVVTALGAGCYTVIS
ncbi:uncharacterized membrane protein YidH (DUF202 family) [Friedmanniella endophytica]|uniref:Uncharacterized membrane protein YidH (DUF202 family) n=1 Tax=Microlunatus kandeliicorticis TaxID=1759536 RepID=A0A7W3INU7_9ACTN|nr:DUF202 domain-containing protein [Microlunatus kandeliicorticis]MBA8792501.1 uncharacterized membrane protein YidH (DUF202 family) [Microlunatus kandeliicorticis]